jgi:ethanolamine ammonia-lyase small subunit
MSNPVPWHALRRLTPARIAIGHTGVSQLTDNQLDFQLAHARARDAVHVALDVESLRQALDAVWPEQQAIVLHSAAESRAVYLQRPDLGRRLDAASSAMLAARREEQAGAQPYDLCIVLADGLSAFAVSTHAAPFLQALRARLGAETWRVASPVIVQQGRVAIGDEIGELLGARLVVVLIGERPGLSSPDSMGLYITWAPHRGLTDESRNCISNVRPAGLGYEDAAARLHYLLAEARKRQLTGVALKDETEETEAPAGGPTPTFLLCAARRRHPIAFALQKA